MQEIIVYIIILSAIVFTILSTIKKVRKLTNADPNKSSACNGCSGCSLTKNGASCSTPIQQIGKFDKH